MVDSITLLHYFPYIALVAVCGFCAYYKTKNNTGLKIIFWCIFLFSALRYNVGWDYEAYDNTIRDKLSWQINRIEWLSRSLMLLARQTFTQLYFIICSFVTLRLVYVVIKKHSSDPALSLFIFLTFSLFYLMTMNIIRNFMAISMVMYAGSLLLDKKYWQYIVIVILAAGIHSSAYLGFLLPVINMLRLSRTINIIMFVASFLIGEILKAYLMDIDSSIGIVQSVQYYIKFNADFTQGGSYKYVFYALAIVLFIFWNRMVKQDSNNKLWLNYFNIGVCAWTAFSFQQTLSLRSSLFFTIWLVILIPALLKAIPVKYGWIAKQAVMVLFPALFFLNLWILASAYNAGLLEQASFLPYRIFLLAD